ncbi:MAG: anti-sigma factor, partial [Mycobacteriales bacterium]
MSHLGDLAAALVDGELDDAARDRALSHIAGCAPCRAEVDAQRRLKALLANQADAAVPAALVARLKSLAPLDRAAPVPLAARARRNARRRPVPARRLLDLRRGLAIALGSVAAAVAMVVLGAPTDSGVAPPVDRFVVEHAA